MPDATLALNKSLIAMLIVGALGVYTCSNIIKIRIKLVTIVRNKDNINIKHSHYCT